MSNWADLRQVVLATTDHDALVAQVRGELRLGRGFGDPELDAHGIVDDTMAVGAHTYLEVVSPTTAEHPMAKWLAARGGSAGYLLSIQVSDVDACLDRCRAEGIRVAHTQFVHGHRIAQLHPGDMSSSVEIDGIAERGKWFWDDLDVERRADARVDDVVAVEIAVGDPTTVAARWAYVLGLDVVQGSSLDLGGRMVHFVPKSERGGVVAVDLRAVDRSGDPGHHFTAAGVKFCLV